VKGATNAGRIGASGLLARTVSPRDSRGELESLAQTHGARFAPKQGWFNPALAK